MYNRYIPGSAGYTRVVVEESEERAERKTNANKDGENAWRKTSPFAFLGGEDKNAGIAGILKSLHLEDLDSGDVLLLLIILLVFLEGDNIELVITLGLMLLLGLGEEKTHDQKE